MRYDREFERYRFSTDRVIDRDTINALYQEYDEYRMTLLTTDFKNSVYRMSGVEPEKNKSLLSILFGTGIGVCMIAMVIALISKKFYLGGALAAALFGVIGISMICGQTMISADRDTNKERVKMVIRGILLLIGATGLGLLMFFKDRFDPDMILILLSVGAFGIAAVWLIVMAIFELLYAALFYNEKVRARCTGFVRMVDSESGGGEGGSLPFNYIRMSPVFEYDYNGERYEALYDELIVKDNADIEYGQYEIIRISSKHPDNVYSGRNTVGNAIVFLIFGLLAAGATSVIVWFGLLS